MIIVSTKITASNSSASATTEGILSGSFTMHGVTKEISFPFKIFDFGSYPWGCHRVGIEAHLSIKTSDYGYG